MPAKNGNGDWKCHKMFVLDSIDQMRGTLKEVVIDTSRNSRDVGIIKGILYFFGVTGILALIGFVLKNFGVIG